jgi:hypothetical protein
LLWCGVWLVMDGRSLSHSLGPGQFVSADENGLEFTIRPSRSQNLQQPVSLFWVPIVRLRAGDWPDHRCVLETADSRRFSLYLQGYAAADRKQIVQTIVTRAGLVRDEKSGSWYSRTRAAIATGSAPALTDTRVAIAFRYRDQERV